MLTYLPELSSIHRQADETDPMAPVWNNGYLSGLDIAALYTFVREYKPAKYVEVGSGNTTRVYVKAVRDVQRTDYAVYRPHSISIEPAPRAETDGLASCIIRQPFEQLTDYSTLTDCGPGDIAFIDNSHRVLPNSDTMVFFMELLPVLKPGVIVHIHYVYLPYDYPPLCASAFTPSNMPWLVFCSPIRKDIRCSSRVFMFLSSRRWLRCCSLCGAVPISEG